MPVLVTKVTFQHRALMTTRGTALHTQDGLLVTIKYPRVVGSLVAIAAVFRKWELLDLLKIRAIRSCCDPLEQNLNLVGQGERASVDALEVLEQRPKAWVGLGDGLIARTLRPALMTEESPFRNVNTRWITT
jgi:hypothetical protein